jgi:hypothetical protein
MSSLVNDNNSSNENGNLKESREDMIGRRRDRVTFVRRSVTSRKTVGNSRREGKQGRRRHRQEPPSWQEGT